MKKIIQIIAISLVFTACNTQVETPVEKSAENPAVRSVEKTVEKVVEKPDPSQAKNRSIATRFYEEVINAHNVEAIDAFAAPTYLEHQYDTHYDSDRKGIKKAFSDYFTAFPDMHVKVNFMMAEGDLVTAQITTTGTNTGPIYGQKGTKKKFEINGVDIIRFKDGKVEEHWGYAEEGKLLTQLGLIRPLVKEGRKEQREANKRKEKKVFPAVSEVK